jgi:putative endonuclease
MKKSYVYIVSNKSRTTLYIGVTSNLIKRIANHKEGKGSLFSKKYKLTDLLLFEEFSDIKDAIAREKQLKRWRRKWKDNLINEQNPQLKDLYCELM